MVTTGVLLASTTLGLASGAAGATTISGGAVPVTVSDTGTANQPGGVAISATGCATNGYVNVSGSCTSGGTVDVTAIGHRFDQGANGTVEGNRIMDMVDSYEVQ